MHPRAQQQRLEVLLGILGFFTAAAFVVAVIAELNGENALFQSLVLVLFLLLFGMTFYKWRQYP